GRLRVGRRGRGGWVTEGAGGAGSWGVTSAATHADGIRSTGAPRHARGAGRGKTRYAIATELPGAPVAPLMGTGLNDHANSYALSAASSSRLRFSLMKMPFIVSQIP